MVSEWRCRDDVCHPDGYCWTRDDLCLQYMNSSPGVRNTMRWTAEPPAVTQPVTTMDPRPPYAVARPRSAPIRPRPEKWVDPYVDPRPQFRTTSAIVHRARRKTFDVKLHNRPLESHYSKYAPFAPRAIDRVDNPHSFPSYDPMSDPHLSDYFARKFGYDPRPPSAVARKRAMYGPGAQGKQRAIYKPGSRPSSGRTKHSRRESGMMYKIVVRTADRKNAGTDARVFIKMKGTKGKIPKKRLYKKSGSVKDSKTSHFKFERGTKHTFKLRAADIGEIETITIEHDGLERKQSWLLESVMITNTASKKSWVFPCNNWLSLFESDCQLSRILYAKGGTKYARTEYEVVTVTGDCRGGGTDANVFVTLYGKKGTTARLPLRNRHKSKTFERGRSDIFVIKAKNVGPLQKVRIQHDNTGTAPGWFLDRVVVTDIKNPACKYYFPCGQWLAKDEGDGLIARDLLGSKDPTAVRRMSKYKITTYTGNKRGAGTDANVFVTLFGEAGDSGERRLDNSKNNFERGRDDTFMIECPNLGPMRKIRIGHDNKGSSAGWFLDKVIVDDVQLSRVYEFPCNRWFAKDEDDGQIQRDLLLTGQRGGYPYQVRVETGDVRNAGTSARVFIEMWGVDGEETSGKIYLDGKFQRGKTDALDIETGSILSPLSKIVIGHDNSGSGPGWYCEKVQVHCPSTGYEQTFLCQNWLALDEGDGLIERELRETISMRQTKTKKVAWNLTVWTTDQRGAGTDANVYFVLYGDKGKSDDISIGNKTDNFEAGQEDNFKVEIEDVGKPYKMRIGHDDSGSFAGWHLDKVEMERVDTGEVYLYKCGRWLDKGEDDGQIVREMPAEGKLIKKPLPVVLYDVEVHTGKKRNAGTNANVFVCLFGELGDTGERPLLKSSNMDKFEKGKVDEFQVEAVTLKKVTKVRIGHDGTGSGSGWYLDKVVIREHGKMKSETIFACDRWLDKGEDDGLIVRELLPEGTPQLLATTSYHVSVKTGDERNAGTDADVFLKIFGAKGDTGLLKLYQSDNTSNKFERDRTDLFKLEAADIGKIERIRIGHDDSGPGSGWFLDKVDIDIPSRGERYVFSCHRWLASDEGDEKTEVELYPTELIKGDVRIPYEVDIYTGDIRGAGTDANVFLQIYGTKGKTEEVQLRNRTDNFEREAVDKFKIEQKDVGPITKIRIGHDGTSFGAGWFLNKVVIQRYPTAEELKEKRKAKKKGLKRQKSASPSRRKPSLSPSRKKKSTKYSSFSDSESEDEKSSKKKKSAKGKKKSKKYSSFSESDSESEDEKPSKKKKSLKDKRKSKKDSSSSESSSEDEKKKKDKKKDKKKKKKSKKDSSSSSSDSEKEEDWKKSNAEVYLFVANRWFAKDEDDKQIVRELVPTDESGKPLEGNILEENEYVVRVYTGDKFGAGTDANVFLSVHGENGDTGERELKDSETNMNKWERGNVDKFTMSAINLGEVKKVKVRHDNKGGGAAWFLDRVEVEDVKAKKKYYFPCQRWLATDEDDGQIARELVPVDKALFDKTRSLKKGKSTTSLRDELGLEMMAQTTTYRVNVKTGDVRGAGTDANVYIILYGENDDTGIMQLKTSKNNSNKFERNQLDEFTLEAVDIGDLKKIKIWHDNKGGFAGWFLESVEINAPSLGQKWYFPCGRWLDKGQDDGKLERELFPANTATEEYNPYVPYEIITYTSDVSGAGTDADVYIVLFGRDTQTEQKSLCANKKERKEKFEKAQKDIFIVEMEDVGDPIEKIRIGHDGKGWGAGWHLEKVEVRRLTDDKKGSITYTFPCKRWLARGEDDGEIVRELLPDKIMEEKTRKDGSMKKKEIKHDALEMKQYQVLVYTGDVKGGGTDANVFINIFGENGDTGERKLNKSETHMDKFERGQVDKFQLEAVDLGKVFKVKIRHDNAMLNPAWFLDKVEVVDLADQETFVFHCERWLGKNKDDGKLERSLYVKGYEGDTSSTSSRRSSFGGSQLSLKSTSPSLKRKNSRGSLMDETIPEGPLIPYNVKVVTGGGDDNGTNANPYIIIMGPKKKTTGRIPLDLEDKSKFDPASVETFAIEGVDVGEVKRIEFGHDGVLPGQGWFVKEVELDVPTAGKHYYFPCKRWLAKDKEDGLISRVLTLQDAESTMLSYTPMVPYEVTVYTGDISSGGTDGKITMTVFGSGGTTQEIPLEKGEDRFERGKVDILRMELDDVGELKKIRVSHNGKGSRPDWYLEKITLRNQDSGELSVFILDDWISKNKGDGQLTKDIPASVGGKATIKKTTYKVSVKTSDERGAGTDANISLIIFGENGDSGELKLKESETSSNKFERNQTDVFKFPDMLSLGDLHKCRVWHDSKGFGAGWHLEYIEVQDQKTDKSFMFPCGRWLAKDEDDKQIMRELVCTTPDTPKSDKEKIAYNIKVVTSDRKEAGTTNDAFLILEGDLRKSKEFSMDNTAKGKYFKQGRTDEFKFTTRNVGTLKGMTLGHRKAGSKDKHQWHVSEVIVENTSTSDKYIFGCNHWIPAGEERHLKLTDTEESRQTAIKNLAPVQYEVVTVTSDEKGAGTDANVTIILYGVNGDTGKRQLKQKFRDLFERGQTDRFQFEALDLGELTKVRIEHDNKGFGADWMLDRVEITNLATNQQWTFPCGQWLSTKKGDGQLYKDLLPRS
ncbi:lipoxygenase homology domain-containing protein 1-like isoform X2 [Branchiostoma floridae x Branchiostoma japonicum]